MYDLVNDIEAYPLFLPWCRSTTVHSRSDDEVRATIEIAKGRLQKSFTTLNRLQRNKMMEVRLLEGPFRRLDGFWRFDALSEDACKVSLDLEFEIAGESGGDDPFGVGATERKRGDALGRIGNQGNMGAAGMQVDREKLSRGPGREKMDFVEGSGR